MSRPKLRLSRLRDIGWSQWDPIGLLASGESWEGKNFADEYDDYLIKAAVRLREGKPEDEVKAYLVEMECDHMGLRMRSDTALRAEAVIKSIQSDRELWRGQADCD